MERESMHMILVALMAIFGLAFAALSEAAFKNLKGSCKSSFIRNGWTAIQALSVCFIVATISFVICITGSGSDCYGVLKPKGEVGTSNPYIIVLCLISGSIMGIGIGMVVEYTKLANEDIEACDDNKDSNKRMAISVTVLSGIVFLGTLGRLGFVWYENYVKPIQGIAESIQEQEVTSPWTIKFS